ncbi:MAG TPA: hypothetical protein ENN54_05525 [Thermoplasmatales archaeon]|nr:hypothetical protein [Thermoplasmatales archaeon]
MTKRAMGMCCLLAAVVLASPASLVSVHPGGEVEAEVFGGGTLGGGWLEEINGVTVVHVSGSHYAMGYQHGHLLQEQVQQNIRAYLAYSPVSYQELLGIWETMKAHMPEAYIRELQGLADGAELTLQEVAAAYMVVVVGDMGCFGFSAWGPATLDGRLYHVRSFDLPMSIQDPVSDRYVHENSVLIVRHPQDGWASLCPSVAGSMHGGGGINERGIAIGQQVCWSTDQTFHGIPGPFRVQQVLDYASTADEAIRFLVTNRTLGWNFVVSDAREPGGYVVEVSANHSYVGSYDSPGESQPPFWSIDHVVRRTNFFVDSTLAATQREHFDPSGLKSFLRLVARTDIFFAVWRSYRAMSEEIERQWGALDLNATMALMRQGYAGDTDWLLRMIIRLAEGTSFNRAWNLWVACPETGDLAVSFAERDKIAFETPVHFFNLYSLLEQDPP